MTHAVLLAAFAAVAALTSPVTACTYPEAQAQMARSFAHWVNGFRAEHGAPPLTISPALTRAARDHACDMANHNLMTHTSSNGGTLRDRLAAADYQSRRAAENVAWSTQAPTAEIAAHLWQQSPGHRRNLLDPNLRDMGFAVAQSPDGQAYYTFVGAAPR